MIRPVVLIEEEPWSELNENNELTLQCEDEEFRYAENYMRKMLYKWRNYPADMIVPTHIPIYKKISGNIGEMEIKENILDTDVNNNIVSHDYQDQLKEAEDIEKLQMPSIIYEKQETECMRDRINELIGDIVPATLEGYHSCMQPWDTISMYRGVTNILIDLIERPEHTHAIMRRMTDIYVERNRQFEQLGLFDSERILLHCTAGLCDELKTPEDENVLCKNIWGRSMAQIFSSVSNDMLEEFEIEYQKEMLKPFGLSYYGCCEALDKRIDVIRQLPNLRKISISPWADVNVAADAIGKDYVLSAKPNPAFVAGDFDKKILTREITTILDACYRNGCSCDIVLKDISTVGHKAKNLTLWEQTVMDIVKSY